MSNTYKKLQFKTPAARMIALIAVTLLFWFVISLSNDATLELTTILTAILAVVLTIVCSVKSSKRFSILFWAVTAYTVLCGISTFYAAEKVFALGEFEKILFGYCLFLLAHFIPSDKKDTACEISCVIVGAVAVFSFLSIDLISTHWFSDLYKAIFSSLGAPLGGIIGLENNVRITSVTLNPNAFSGLAGIAILLSAGIVLHDENANRRIFALVALSVNTLAFILTFSMGASGMLILAYLGLLIMEKPDFRKRLGVLTVETLLISLLAVVPIYSTSFQEWNGFQPIPLLCTVLSAVLLCLSERFIAGKISSKRNAGKKGKLLIVLVILLLVAFIVCAVTLTAQIGLSKDDTLHRSAYLKAGEYTVTVDSDRSLKNVRITTQSLKNTINHTSDVLYDGTQEQITFSVPSDSIVVYFDLTADDNTLLRSVNFSGAQNGSLKLKYVLLPGFIANRLQGLFANQNAIQRFVFFRDGLRIFAAHPLRGSGLGSFENGIFGVSDFYYETKYVHNHYIQMLSDTGIVGLLSFAALLWAGFYVLKKKMQTENSFLAPELLAVLLFMTLHALVELTFSDFFYVPISFLIFALADVGGAELSPASRRSSDITVWSLRIVSLLMLIYVFMIIGYRQAKQEMKQPTFVRLESAIEMDHFGWEENAIIYAFNAYSEKEPNESRIRKADAYLARLEKSEASGTPLYLARIYFTKNEPEKAFENLYKYVQRSSSFPKSWNLACELIQNYYQDTEAFRIGIQKLVELMEHRGAAEFDGNPLEPANLQWLTTVQ